LFKKTSKKNKLFRSNLSLYTWKLTWNSTPVFNVTRQHR